MRWHRKLGHMLENGLKILFDKKLLPGLKIISLPFYEHRVINKQHKLRFSRFTIRSKDIQNLVGSNVWESLTISLRGANYLVLFVDDYSKRCWVYSIKRKLDVFLVFKTFKTQKKLEMGKKIKCLRTNNGKEFCSQEFPTFWS